MKNSFFYFIAVLASVSFFSCKSENKEKAPLEEIMEFRGTLSTSDTTQMLQLCDEAMEQLKNHSYEKVLSSLYEYNDSTKEVKPLSETLMRQYRSNFETFPVIEYRRVYYSFLLEGCNDVKYEVIFATPEQTGTDEPAKTAFMFNPVKIDGQWYLCVKTEKDKLDPFNR